VGEALFMVKAGKLKNNLMEEESLVICGVLDRIFKLYATKLNSELNRFFQL